MFSASKAASVLFSAVESAGSGRRRILPILMTPQQFSSGGKWLNRTDINRLAPNRFADAPPHESKERQRSNGSVPDATAAFSSVATVGSAAWSRALVEPSEESNDRDQHDERRHFRLLEHRCSYCGRPQVLAVADV